jgi:hypothetical protein
MVAVVPLRAVSMLHPAAIALMVLLDAISVNITASKVTWIATLLIIYRIAARSDSASGGCRLYCEG